jgi:acyl-CoA synthetase (AMP-forming)/AMP-acid ligase II/acyl carrier protein
MLDGLVPVMLSPDSRPGRIKAICVSVEPGLLIVDKVVADELAIADLSDVRVIAIPPATRLEMPYQGLIAAAWRGIGQLFKRDTADTSLDLPASGREPRLPAADDTIAYVLFTSGTTKSPSGVQISRSSVMAQLETLTRLFGYDVDSRIFNATPLAHTDGLVQGLLLAASNGATLLRPGPFSLPNLEEWLDSLGRFEATHFITNPTVLALIDRFAGHDDYFDDDGFFGILSSASILRPSLWEKFEARFSCSIYNLYGMTETVANATYAGRHPEMGPVGTIGIPVDCEVRLMEVSATGEEHESALEGELQVKGENVFQGYWKDPVRTAHTLTSDGWMRTGDLARRQNDGGLEIIGRITTVINMGGQSIMPEEIDEVLAVHPAVVDVATVGMSDPEFEEVAVSAVVLELPTSELELTEHCRQRLEHLKVPKRILVVEKIPRGGAGKPKTGELRDLLTPLLGSSVTAPASDDDSSVSAESVYEMAANVFRVPTELLNVDSSPATVEGWDSFNQLSLMIEAELRFGIRIPASQVASIRTLGDLHQAINTKH